MRFDQTRRVPININKAQDCYQDQRTHTIQESLYIPKSLKNSSMSCNTLKDVPQVPVEDGDETDMSESRARIEIKPVLQSPEKPSEENQTAKKDWLQ